MLPRKTYAGTIGGKAEKAGKAENGILVKLVFPFEFLILTLLAPRAEHFLAKLITLAWLHGNSAEHR